MIRKEKNYACMVDVLGRVGHPEEAHDFILNMHMQPNADVWESFLGACMIHHTVVLVECVAKHVFVLNSQNSIYYILLSNTYAMTSRWDDATKVRTTMKEMGLKMTPVCNFIEVNKKVHEFLVEDITSLI